MRYQREDSIKVNYWLLLYYLAFFNANMIDWNVTVQINVSFNMKRISKWLLDTLIECLMPDNMILLMLSSVPIL